MKRYEVIHDKMGRMSMMIAMAILVDVQTCWFFMGEVQE